MEHDEDSSSRETVHGLAAGGKSDELQVGFRDRGGAGWNPVTRQPGHGYRLSEDQISRIALTV